jgi:N-acetylmuramic acid 6-phosphate etherase
MLERLLTEQRNPASRDIDEKPTADILDIINHADQEVAPAVAREIPNIARAVDGIVAAIENGGRLFYIGAGTSGRLGVLDAAECPPTFNVSPDLVQGIIAGGEPALARATEASEDDPELGKRDLLARGFRPGDVLVGIAASGRTPYVLGAIEQARSMGCLTAGISCTPDSALARACDIAITPQPGPEIIAGSTRMRAGTATKLVLNMLTTATMIRLGFVYRNLMVNVQPKNSKLEDRARRIIAEAAEVPYERAAELLTQARGNVKTAIVMGRLGVDSEAAAGRLEASRGRLAQALGD